MSKFEKIISEIGNHFLIYFFIILAIIFGLFLGQGVVGLVLFSLAIRIFIGEEKSQ